MGKTSFFDGREIFFPGTYVKRTFDGNFAAQGTLGNVLYILGESDGGIPYNATDYDGTTALSAAEKVNVLTRVQDAYDVLINGELFDAARFSFEPALDSQYTPPPTIYCVRVNQATRASRTLEKSSVDVLKLHSELWGLEANKIATKISAGTTSGKKVEIRYNGTTTTVDDIEQIDFEIQYTGDASTATMTINSTTISTTLAGDQTDGSTDLSLTKAQYSTIGEVVDYINSQTGYTATVKFDRAWESQYLDYITASNIKTAAIDIKSDAENLKRTINNSFGSLIYAELITTTDRNVPDNDTAFVYLSGATATAATNTDWSSALTMLEGLNADFVVLLSGDSTHFTYLKSHCEAMSAIDGENERQGWCGSNKTDVKSDLITDCKALNSSLINYSATRFKANDKNGVETTYAGYHLAAMYASMMAGNGILFPLTLKSMKINGLADNWDNDDLKDFIKASAIILKQSINTAEYEIQMPFTTYQGSLVLQGSILAMRLALFISKDSRSKLNQKIKEQKTALNDAVINNLKDYIEQELLPSYKTLGYLTDDPETGRPAFDNVDFTIIGDEFHFTFEGVLPVELNKIFATHNFKTVGQA